MNERSRLLQWLTPMPDIIIDPTDPKIDRWLRRQEPRVELALRYAMRGRYPAAQNSVRFAERIDELFDRLRPAEHEYAAIIRHARELGAQIDGYLSAIQRPKK